jgi:hypothetical protein
LGTNLRFPTGSEDDFQGGGDTVVTPFFAMSLEVGRLGLFTSNGIDVNAKDLDRSRVRYGGGVTLSIFDRLALLTDVVGTSNMTTDTRTIRVPNFVNTTTGDRVPPSEAGLDIPDFRRARVDLETAIVDLSVGLKANPWRSMILFVNFLVPLNDDGLRTDFTPAAGMEMTF